MLLEVASARLPSTSIAQLDEVVNWGTELDHYGHLLDCDGVEGVLVNENSSDHDRS